MMESRELRQLALSFSAHYFPCPNAVAQMASVFHWGECGEEDWRQKVEWEKKTSVKERFAVCILYFYELDWLGTSVHTPYLLAAWVGWEQEWDC